VFGSGGAQNPNYSMTIAAPPAGSGPGPTSNFTITLFMNGLTPSQQGIFQTAAARWSQVITGDLPNASFNGTAVDDLLINASSVPIDGVGGILGQAAPDRFRSSLLPYHGFMEFDSADMASMEASGLLLSVVLHEMGHILGIGTIWSSKGLLSGTGGNNPIFIGANATARYNQIFGTTATGVPVEAGGGPGTALSHWRDSVFTNELMTGFAGPGTFLPLSAVTVGSLADLGYTVNYAAADPFTPSVSQINAARAAAASSGTTVRAAALTALPRGIVYNRGNSFSDSDFGSSFATVDALRSQPSVSSSFRSVEQNLVDAVIATAVRPTAFVQSAATDDSSTSQDIASFDEDTPTDSCAADQAWDALAASWDFWRALANA
jgi:hypothetical protein